MNIEKIIKKYWKDISKKENVIGYSKNLQKKVSYGKTTEVPCIRIYVRKKKDLSILRSSDIIPMSIEGIITDVVEIGDIKALQVDKTTRWRPVELGLSIGNWNITAGSLGMLFKKIGSEQIYAGSNSHVLSERPDYKPEEILEKRILQPGSYHQGKTEDNIVGTYFWHKRILPVGLENCKIGGGLSRILNFFLRVFNRRGRFKYESDTSNHIDFAVYIPTVEHILKVSDDSLTNEPFIGLLFAGSDSSGIICKSKYIEQEGFIPMVQSTEVQEGDKVKGCSFWCSFQTKVLDSSGVVTVSYGDFQAAFEDIIIVENENGIIKGGWSGSGWRKIE